MCVPMKILNLVLYSENDPVYPLMRDVIREHSQRYPYVQTLFYMYDQAIAADYDISGDLLRIRGVETYVPGILNKTVDAMHITQNWDYDLLIRTNISTIVDFGGIVGYCRSPDFFAGGYIHTVSSDWRDEKGGLFDGRFTGKSFISGCCMILSRAAVSLVTNRRQFIDTSVIDDVTISDFLFYKMGKTFTNLTHKVVLYANMYDPTKLVFRNFTYGNRMADTERMRHIASKILP